MGHGLVVKEKKEGMGRSNINTVAQWNPYKLFEILSNASYSK